MKEAIQKKINELQQRKKVQWDRLQAASRELEQAKAAALAPLVGQQGELVALRDIWCATNDQVKAYELLLADADGFGAEVGK